MKRKVLFSIIGIALFAVAIGLSLNKTQEDNLKVKNIEALAAGYDHIMDEDEDGGTAHAGATCYMACGGPVPEHYACLWCTNCGNAENGKMPAGPGAGTCD